jgi:hypothetical protein
MREIGMFTAIHNVNFQISLYSGSSGNEGVPLLVVAEKNCFPSYITELRLIWTLSGL